MMRHLFCILLTFFFTNCSDKQKTTVDNSLVLAKVGSKNITIQDSEFINISHTAIRLIGKRNNQFKNINIFIFGCFI